MTAHPGSTPATAVLPPELLRSAPRPVALSRAGKAVLIVSLTLLLGGIVGGVLLYSVAARDDAENKLTASDSAGAQGEVVELGRTRGKDRRRVVVYQYTVDGRTYHGRSVLRSRDRRSFAIGAPVEIRYARAQPDLSWMPGYEPRGVPLPVPVVVGFSFTSVAALLLFFIQRERALLSEGRPAVARVTGAKKLSQHGKGSYYRIDYEFTILSGARRTGRVDVGKQPPAVGSTITIVYDRERPEKSAIYPLSLVRVEVPQS